MITRREALKSLPFIPLFGTRGYTVSAVRMAPKHFLLFFDAQTVDAQTLMNISPVEDMPPLDAVIYYVPLKLRVEQTIEDAIRIYEVSDDPRP